MPWWGELAAKAVALADKIAGMIRQNRDQRDGAAKQREATDEQTIKTLGDVGAAVPRDESDKLWQHNKAKYGDDGKTNG